MKRLHVHVAVSDISQSVGFYSTMFGAQPSVLKDDYAKWMLDDPRVNFAISTHGAAPGLDHLGIQVEEAGELSEIAGRLKAAGASTFDETASGLRWETFHTLGEAAVYGEDRSAEMIPEADTGACCAPRVEPAKAKGCCGQ